MPDAAVADCALAREMLEAADVVERFDPACVEPWLQPLAGAAGILLTGEGSSRIFPARRALHEARARGWEPKLATEGATQALEHDLSRHAVVAASNSGRTKEVVRLFQKLAAESHPLLFAVVAHAPAPLTQLAHAHHVLSCGPEMAVAATKSVVEQALFYQALCARLRGTLLTGQRAAAAALRQMLEQHPPEVLVNSLAAADTIYVAGRDDGVAEELALKAMEISRQRAVFLEGTFALHGVEEVMRAGDAMLVIEPFAEEEATLVELCKRSGMPALVISARPTALPAIRIPRVPGYEAYVQLAAGWNLLLRAGLARGVDVDKPERARKVGNEYVE